MISTSPCQGPRRAGHWPGGAGAAIREGPVTQDYGMREVVVSDSDGLSIALGEGATTPAT